MKYLCSVTLAVALLATLPAFAQRNPLEQGKKNWMDLINEAGALPEATAAMQGLPENIDLTPPTWDGTPEVVEEDIYDPPPPYFETAEFYRILTPITFTATKGPDYVAPTQPGNAAEDYWRLFQGVPTADSYALFVQATNKKHCDFFEANLISDPYGYEFNYLIFPIIAPYLGRQWAALPARAREQGLGVKADFYHRLLTMADHLESQQMNLHWAWEVYWLRKEACSGLMEYYRGKGDRGLEQKYRQYSSQSLAHYRTVRKRFIDLSRQFVEGDVEAWRAYVQNGPNVVIRKELLLISAVVLPVLDEAATAEEIRAFGQKPGFNSIKVLRYTRLGPQHRDAVYQTLRTLAEDAEGDPVIQKCAQWVLTSNEESVKSKMVMRNTLVAWQIRRDPMETGM